MGGDKKLVDALIRTVMLSKTAIAKGVMGGDESELDWVFVDVQKEHGREEVEVLWPHRPKKPA